MTEPVMMVASEGWRPALDRREELTAVHFEVIVPDAIYRLQSHDFRGESAAVFVDKPSLGADTIDIVADLRQRLVTTAKIFVLDEDPDASDIVEITLAGADVYAPTDLLSEFVLGNARWTTRATESAGIVIRRHALSALRAAAHAPVIRTQSLTNVLLDAVARADEPQKPFILRANPQNVLIRRAKPDFEQGLIKEFNTSGVGYAPILAEEEVEGSHEPPGLFWNTRFPRDLGILRNKPHIVVAGAPYLLQTVIEPRRDGDAESRPEESSALVDKVVRFRLEAQDGMFTAGNHEGPQGDAEWTDTALSPPLPCTQSGTDAFEVWYRPTGPSPAVITAFLIVDNGSVDECRFELLVVPDETSSKSASVVETPTDQRSVVSALSHPQQPDYTLFVRRNSADLLHQTAPLLSVTDLPTSLSDLVNAEANAEYAKLRKASQTCDPAPGSENPLKLRNPEAGMMALAQAGARLHYRLFRQPLEPALPRKWGELADRLCGLGSQEAPMLMQIISQPRKSPFPVPWGILYDRYGDGVPNLSNPADVDPEGFWGRRFDIFRSVWGSGLNPQRGARRRVKPVIGESVPRNQEQLGFVDDLRKKGGDELTVDPTIRTVQELKNWARDGSESDLAYLFCHARPARAGDTDSWLGFGVSEDEQSATTRAGIDELNKLWGKERLTNPVVILNACSSAQQDLAYGAPFAEFFAKVWRAQAFIGTDWPVNSGFADVFGQRILNMILVDKLSVRDALRQASNEAAQVSNYFPLMYAVYGLSTVRFIDPVTAA